MYETFAAVILGTCGVLGYTLIHEDKRLGSSYARKNRGLEREKWNSIVDGEPELEELCVETLEGD